MVQVTTENHGTFQQYPGQSLSQQPLVELDCRNGNLRTTYDPEIGGARPCAVVFGHIQRWKIPLLTDESAEELLGEITHLAQKIIDGYTPKWDGRNHVANFTPDAQAADDEISEICADLEGDLSPWTAADYYQVDPPEVGPLMTDEDLGKLEEQLEKEIKEEAEPGMLVYDIEEYLEERRNDLLDEKANEILAKFVEDFEADEPGMTPGDLVVERFNCVAAEIDEDGDISCRGSISDEYPDWYGLDAEQVREFILWLVDNGHIQR
jgi:hypothetical protein